LILDSKSNALDTYDQAILNQEIKSYLKIIQVNLIYVAKLEDVAISLNKGANELKYLEEKFESDVAVASVIGSVQINEIIKEIDIVINKYLPYADEIVLNTNGVQIDLKEIWKDILLRKEHEEKESAERSKQEKIAQEKEKLVIIASQEQEKKRKIIEEQEKNEKEKYFNSPAGRLEKFLDDENFARDWYDRIDRKYMHYTKSKILLKNDEKGVHEIYIPRIIKLDKYVIIELVWEYRSIWAMFMNPKEIKLIDKKLVFHYPENVFDDKGNKYHNRETENIAEEQIKIFCVFKNLLLEEIQNATFVYGEKDQYFLEFTVVDNWQANKTLER